MHRFSGVGPEITRLPLHQAMKTRRLESMRGDGVLIYRTSFLAVVRVTRIVP